MTDRIHTPQRPNMAHFEIPEAQPAEDDWKALLGQLIDDYRHQYVLHRQPAEKPGGALHD